MLTLQVKEQIIENLTPDEKFIRGTVGAKCQIKFDEFWSKYEKTIVFQRKCQKPINIIVNELDNEIEIPYEILEKHGKFKIGVFGIIENEVLPTLWSTDIEILCGTDTHGTAPHPYTPNEIDQLRLSKQDKLTAGSGIKIENNVISTSGDVTVDQTYNSNSSNAQSGKAVAEAIKNIPQADWQQNDETKSDYIKNRTHYATKAFEDITWDGDKTDHIMFDLGDGIQFFKVSDKTPSIDELIGGTFTINTPDGEMDFPENLDKSFIAEVQGALVIAEENVLIIHNIDVFVEEVLGFTFDNATNGVYFLCNTVEDTYTSKLVGGEKVVKKINEKYLPDISIVAKTGNYNDLKNKPEVYTKTEIDQTYNPESIRPQSGKAVAQAIDEKGIGFSFTYDETYKPMSKIKVIPQNAQIGYLTYYPKDEEYVVKYIHDNKIGVSLDAAGNCIAARDGNGNLWTGTPIDDEDCTNKKYVDEKLDSRINEVHGELEILKNGILPNNYYNKTEVDAALQNVSIDATTTPTADKIPKYNQYGQLIVNCTEYEPGTEKAKVYSGESIPRDLWKAYINNFHQRITNVENNSLTTEDTLNNHINTSDRQYSSILNILNDKKISFQYATKDTEITLKSNCLYLVIDHSGSNNTNVYITKSDNTKVVATTQGDSAVENFPAFRLSLIFVPHDYYHTMVIGQTGKFSLTNFSPLYTKQVIWDNTNKNMFIKTTGTGMSIWEVNI